MKEPQDDGMMVSMLALYSTERANEVGWKIELLDGALL
jgi:hypothetical protein